MSRIAGACKVLAGSWAGLVVSLILLSVGWTICTHEGGMWAGWKVVCGWVSPSNFLNLAVVFIALLPTFGLLAAAERFERCADRPRDRDHG